MQTKIQIPCFVSFVSRRYRKFWGPTIDLRGRWKLSHWAPLYCQHTSPQWDTEPTQDRCIFQYFLCCDTAMFGKCLQVKPNFEWKLPVPALIHPIRYKVSKSPEETQPLMIADENSRSYFAQFLLSLNLPIPSDQGAGDICKCSSCSPLRNRMSSHNPQEYTRNDPIRCTYQKGTVTRDCARPESQDMERWHMSQ